MTEASIPATTENPLKKAYWLGRVDPRPLALFRLLFCSVVLFDLLARLGEVRAFLSDEGWAPAETIPRFSDSWSLFRLVGSPPAVMALYLAGVATVVAVLVGYRTRLAQVAMYVFLASAHFRNGRFFGTGLDHVTGTLSFWLLFADTGAVWSMDWLRKRRDGSAVPALGLRLLQWQVALIFFFASLSKWATWRDGLAIYHVLQIKGFTTPLGPALVAWPWLCIALNWLVLCLELAVPLLLIPLAPLAPRWMRAAGILGGTALFIGIQAVLEVGCFAELMIAGLSLFVLPEWLDRLGWAGRSKATEAAPVTGEAAVPWIRTVLFGVGITQLGLVIWSLIAPLAHVPTGDLIVEELHQIKMRQLWGMFTEVQNLSNSSWTDVGTLADGTRREVLEGAVPEIVAAPWPGVHWAALRFEMTLPNAEQIRRQVVGFACREFDRTSPVPLRSLELDLHEQAVHDPGEPPREERARVYNEPCPGAEDR